MVGGKTVIDDNPALTTRDWEGKSPIRIVIDTQNSLPKTAQIFNKESPTLIFHNKRPKQIVKKLYEENIQSVIIEGGAITLSNFIEAGLWDEARVFYGQKRFGNGVRAPHFKHALTAEHIEYIEEDLLLSLIHI